MTPVSTDMEVSPAVRIELSGTNIQIEVVNAKRISKHGFGLFLENPKPGEIAITKQALDALNRQPYRSGLQGMEVFNSAAKAIGWCAAIVPLNAVSVDSDHDWFEKVCAVE